MSGQRKGRIGVKGAANMDVFNISLLKMLKTKNERLSLMERMSNVNVDLGRYIEPEEESFARIRAMYEPPPCRPSKSTCYGQWIC